MRKECRLIRAFGRNESGVADVPKKISGTMISRIINGRETGCSRCFPHGPETENSTFANIQRTWKNHRKHQWRSFT